MYRKLSCPAGSSFQSIPWGFSKGYRPGVCIHSTFMLCQTPCCHWEPRDVHGGTCGLARTPNSKSSMGAAQGGPTSSLRGTLRPPSLPHTQGHTSGHQGWSLEDLPSLHGAPPQLLSTMPLGECRTRSPGGCQGQEGRPDHLGQLCRIRHLGSNTDLLDQTIWGGAQEAGSLKTSPRRVMIGW
jgi:hypothetical protein